MRTLSNTVLKSSLVAIILLASLFSLNASAATVDIANTEIKKVVVTGNTKVLIIQSNTEYVTMDDEQLDKVTLTQAGSTLTINSSQERPVTVVVYVKNIYRIDASGKASVKTLGKFNVQNLQVILKDNATARVKSNTVSLYTVIGDNAKLELLGTTDEHISKMEGYAKLDAGKFAALRTENVNSLAGTMASASIKK